LAFQIISQNKLKGLGAFVKWRNATVSFVICLSVCLSVYSSTWNNSAPSERIFVTFYILVFSETLSRKFKFH